jgi:hypothetical protein
LGFLGLRGIKLVAVGLNLLRGRFILGILGLFVDKGGILSGGLLLLLLEDGELLLGLTFEGRGIGIVGRSGRISILSSKSPSLLLDFDLSLRNLDLEFDTLAFFFSPTGTSNNGDGETSLLAKGVELGEPVLGELGFEC